MGSFKEYCETVDVVKSKSSKGLEKFQKKIIFQDKSSGVYSLRREKDQSINEYVQ